jgi:hypothetical protein
MAAENSFGKLHSIRADYGHSAIMQTACARWITCFTLVASPELFGGSLGFQDLDVRPAAEQRLKVADIFHDLRCMPTKALFEHKVVSPGHQRKVRFNTGYRYFKSAPARTASAWRHEAVLGGRATALASARRPRASSASDFPASVMRLRHLLWRCVRAVPSESRPRQQRGGPTIPRQRAFKRDGTSWGGKQGTSPWGPLLVGRRVRLWEGLGVRRPRRCGSEGNGHCTGRHGACIPHMLHGHRGGRVVPLLRRGLPVIPPALRHSAAAAAALSPPPALCSRGLIASPPAAVAVVSTREAAAPVARPISAVPVVAAPPVARPIPLRRPLHAAAALSADSAVMATAPSPTTVAVAIAAATAETAAAAAAAGAAVGPLPASVGSGPAALSAAWRRHRRPAVAPAAAPALAGQWGALWHRSSRQRPSAAHQARPAVTKRCLSAAAAAASDWGPLAAGSEV